MRVLLFGYSSIGARALRTLLRKGQSVLAVFTHADDPGENIWFESLVSLARAQGIPVEFLPTRSPLQIGEHADALDSAWLSRVKALQPDLILSASFRALLPKAVLDIPRKAALNLHGSLLPRYRGRAPLNWVLVRGETETGMTLHHMTEKPDAGDIVAQIRLEIGPDETAQELQLRLDDAVEELLETALPWIESGAAPRIPQDHSLSTTFGRRRPADGRFEWSWPAQRIHNLVRAVTRPFPGAFFETRGERIFVWRTRVCTPSEGAGLQPGEFLQPETGIKAPLPPSVPCLAGTGLGTMEILDWSREVS